jgi:hypothetical protein
MPQEDSFDLADRLTPVHRARPLIGVLDNTFAQLRIVEQLDNTVSDRVWGWLD